MLVLFLFFFLFSYLEACLKSLLRVTERLLWIRLVFVWCAVCTFICGLVGVCERVCVWRGGACIVCVSCVCVCGVCV